MKLPDEYDDQSKMGKQVVTSIIVGSLFVAAILVLVLLWNHKDKPKTETTMQDTTEQNTEDTGDSAEGTADESPSYVTLPDSEELIGDSTLKPGDLDFWGMYPEETSRPEETEDKGEEVTSDPSTDGKHTLVIDKDNKEEWVLISPYLPKNEYDFTKLVSQSNLMKYYEDGKQVSFVGVDISKYQDYIDFVKLKKAGIDYCMIRVGARGYGSGQLLLDDYFTENIKRATDAGLEVGVYFYSQAITKEEAVEEANMVIENIKDYQLTYPVAFDMEFVENDTARIEALSKDDRTKIAKAFLETIKASGYKTMIYGNKDWLIKRIDLSKLSDYDIWLSQPGDLPDYPYTFTMWQYSVNASVDGIAGYADMNISFIDYSAK